MRIKTLPTETREYNSVLNPKSNLKTDTSGHVLLLLEKSNLSFPLKTDRLRHVIFRFSPYLFMI